MNFFQDKQRIILEKRIAIVIPYAVRDTPHHIATLVMLHCGGNATKL